MHKFHFRPGKSAFMALVLGAAALLAGWTWLTSDNGLWLGFALLCGLGAGKLLGDGLSDTPALTVGPDGVGVRGTWSGLTVTPWSQVQGLSVEVMTLRYLGIIPVARHETLVVRCRGGGLFGGRKLRLALKMVELPAGGAAALMSLLHQAQSEAMAEGAYADPGVRRSAIEPEGTASTFDADAALARYLARKEAAAPAAATAASQPAQPPRPVFGRKPQAG